MFKRWIYKIRGHIFFIPLNILRSMGLHTGAQYTVLLCSTVGRTVLDFCTYCTVPWFLVHSSIWKIPQKHAWLIYTAFFTSDARKTRVISNHLDDDVLRTIIISMILDNTRFFLVSLVKTVSIFTVYRGTTVLTVLTLRTVA